MSEPLPRPWTVEDFLAWERTQEEKYEFVDGRIRMMVGGSNAHTTIKDNIVAALRRRLHGGPCRAFGEGPKVATAATSVYPDAVVTCAPVDPSDDHVREPVVAVEVLSRSTADYDRGAKWVAYREIPTLRHYVLVAQDRRRVEVFGREGDVWSLRIVEPPAAAVALPAIGVELALDEIYEDSGT
jgi:Uma2 family endonuclease